MYNDFVMSQEDIEQFKALIPDYCVGLLKGGSLYGLVVINEESSAAPVVGIVLYRFVQDFIEVEWVELTEEYDLPDYGADMVVRLLNKARVMGGVRGVRARFREDDRMAEFFPEYEFERSSETGGVYRFILSDVSSLNGVSVKELDDSCISLAKADNKAKNGILNVLLSYEEALPISSPVVWDSSEQDCSYIFVKNNEAQGVVLVEKKAEELTLSFLFSSNNMATMTLLKKAFQTAKEKYGESFAVACPVVNEVSKGLVEKIVRKYEHDEFVLAEALLPMGTGTLSDYEYFSADKKA